jgi:hypothetical protein
MTPVTMLQCLFFMHLDGFLFLVFRLAVFVSSSSTTESESSLSQRPSGGCLDDDLQDLRCDHIK